MFNITRRESKQITFFLKLNSEFEHLRLGKPNQPKSKTQPLPKNVPQFDCSFCKQKFKDKVVQEKHQEMYHRQYKFSCSKCNFIAETDKKKLDTHIVMKHFKEKYSGAQNLEKFECNEFYDYFDIREALIKQVKKRGKCKKSI